ncbi:MAG: hypothetical protein IKO66_03845, partial [Paludibacteraceae bacterium]|nr:hypothetical protein [Paludibacteraceae bacterium]
MSGHIHIARSSPHFATLLLVVALLCLCASCSRVQSIREARTIVAEADSLRNAGQSLSPFTFHLSPSKSDSTTIASAVSALEPLRLIYPTDYAHANYYYGRLLREAGNQPEAMLAFLRVVHSRTNDHEIIARSYSNMANMCRLAADHELAYDIYKYSTEEFLKAKDSTAFYYAINNMAFELAEQKRKDESISLTNQIENECTDYHVLTKIWETRSDAYVRGGMYDSAIYCVRELQSRGNDEPTGYMIMAQAYSGLEQYDSAVVYAKQVAQRSTSWFDLNNAYYILANEDSTKDKEEALQCTRDRSDIQKLIEIRQGQLSQATQLLEQDLSRKPNLTWLWATLATLCIIATSTSIYI